MKFNNSKKKLKPIKSISRNIHLRINSNPIELSHTYITQFNNSLSTNMGKNSKIFKTIKSYANIKIKNDNKAENLISNYLYQSPNISSNYEDFITRSNRNFYYQQKNEISRFLNQTKKSTTVDINEENLPHIYTDKQYRNPIESLGSLLRNKNIYNKILKNYNLKTLNVYSKGIERYSTEGNLKKMKQKIKITSIVPKTLEKENNNLFQVKKKPTIKKEKTLNKDNSLNNINKNENENNNNENKENIKNKEEKKDEHKKIIAIPSTAFQKGSLFLLCKQIYENTNFPESREQFSMDIEINSNKIYLFGGLNSNMKNPNLWRLNPNEIKWNKLKSTNYTEPRLGHSGTVYQNKYIIFGGRYYNSNIFASLDIYNIDNNNWFSPYEKPFFQLRRNHISCMIGSHMFIHGGISEKGEYLSDSYLLNLNPYRWSSLTFSKYTIPPTLAYHSCALVVSSDISNNPKFNIYKYPENINLKRLQSKIQIKGLYVFGGKNKEDSQPSNNLYALLIGKKPLEWIQIETKGQSPSPRYMTSMNYFEEGNYIIIHGGRNDYSINMVMKDTYILEMSRLEWLRVDFGQNNNIVKNRCSHQSCISGKTLFIFGGMDEMKYVGSALFVVNLDPGVSGNMIQKAVSIFGFEFGGNFVNGLSKALKKIIARKREEKRLREEKEKMEKELGYSVKKDKKDKKKKNKREKSI